MASLNLVYFTAPWVHFIPAVDSSDNMAIVELSPDLFEDGIYTLASASQRCQRQ